MLAGCHWLRITVSGLKQMANKSASLVNLLQRYKKALNSKTATSPAICFKPVLTEGALSVVVLKRHA